MDKVCWFVEQIMEDDRFEGWYTAPAEGYGGWITNDPLKAKQYTEAEARAVVQVLNYFRVPFHWYRWVATEHIFIDNPQSGG